MKIFLRILFGVSIISILLGVILSAIGFTMDIPASTYEYNTYEISESYEGVKSIDYEIAYGNVIIKEGDSFHIEGSNLNEEEFSSTIEDNVWIIRDNYDIGNEISLFNFRVSMDTWKLRRTNDVPKIIITIPTGFHADNLNITLGAGSINAKNLSTNKAKIYVGAGYCKIDKLTATEESSYTVGAGELIVENIDAKDVTIDVGLGSLLITSGNITGDNYIKSGVGSVDLNINGDEEDYNYSVDCGIGSVIINNNTYNGIINTKIKGKDADNTFDLVCGIGKIKLKIS